MPDMNKPQAQPKKAAVYIALKDFELDGETYKAGDEIALPPAYKRDPAFETMRGKTKRPAEVPGIAFVKDGPVIDKKTGERNSFRMILPVKEQ